MTFQRKMKMMKDKLHTILLLTALVMMVASWVMLYCSKTEPNIEKVDTVITSDTVFKTDTFRIEKLVPKKVVEIKRDTFYTKDSSEVVLVTENKEYKDTISTNDGDSIILNNFISGINPQLDSAKVSLKKKEVTNTIEITKYVEKKRTIWDRFSLGAGIGYGYGLKNKDLEPFVGFSLTYNL